MPPRYTGAIQYCCEFSRPSGRRTPSTRAGSPVANTIGITPRGSIPWTAPTGAASMPWAPTVTTSSAAKRNTKPCSTRMSAAASRAARLSAAVGSAPVTTAAATRRRLARSAAIHCSRVSSATG